MEPKQIMDYLINHVNDCSSVKLSSVSTILVKRCYTKKLQKGRFVESKEYKIKLPLIEQLSIIIERINQDEFYQNGLFNAEKLDSEIVAFCNANKCKCSIVYNQDWILVEKFVLEDVEHGLLFQIPIKGRVLYNCVMNKFNECINSELQKNAVYFEESVLEYVAKHQSGINNLLSSLSEAIPESNFSFLYNKYSRCLEIFMDSKFLYEAKIDENFEFNSLPGKLDEILTRIRKTNELREQIEINATRIKDIAQLNCEYYQWLDTFKVSIFWNRKSYEAQHFDVRYDSITTVSKMFDDAIAGLENHDEQE